MVDDSWLMKYPLICGSGVHAWLKEKAESLKAEIPSANLEEIKSTTKTAKKFPAEFPLFKTLTAIPIRRTIAPMAIQKKMSPEQMREYIHSLRGKFKMMPSDKPFAEWMREMKQEEIELEERKLEKHKATGEK